LQTCDTQVITCVSGYTQVITC